MGLRSEGAGARVRQAAPARVPGSCPLRRLELTVLASWVSPDRRSVDQVGGGVCQNPGRVRKHLYQGGDDSSEGSFLHTGTGRSQASPCQSKEAKLPKRQN